MVRLLTTDRGGLDVVVGSADTGTGLLPAENVRCIVVVNLRMRLIEAYGALVSPVPRL